MHSQNNTITPTNSSLYRFFNRIYRQLSLSMNNEPELRTITPEWTPTNLDTERSLILASFVPPQPIHTIDLVVHDFPRQINVPQMYQENNITQTRTDIYGLMFSSRRFDHETHLIVRARDSSNQEEAHRWWADVRRSQMNSELAVPFESLNSTRLESYSNLAIDDDFICGISRDIMTNPVYDPAFPQQKYDLLVIREWLNEHGTNPCTRTPLSTENLVYDEELKERIDQFVNSTLTQKSWQF